MIPSTLIGTPWTLLQEGVIMSCHEVPAQGLSQVREARGDLMPHWHRMLGKLPVYNNKPPEFMKLLSYTFFVIDYFLRI